MHSESYSPRYRPSSPLSPKMTTGYASLLPPSPRSRASHSKQGSRVLQLSLPNCPPFPSLGQTSSPPSGVQSPAITLNRGAQLTPMDSPRLMREKQKELIARAQLSSKLAASSMSAKPGAPRLDPLGSPKGPVTPLALEDHEVVDYFSVAGAGRHSPTASPGIRSSRSSPSSGKEENVMKNKRHMELYQ